MKACPKCGKRFLGNEEFCPSDGETLVEIDDKKTEDPLVGTTVDGRYQVEKKLGEGGMGVVYLATHAMIGNRCALKVLRGELSGEGEVAERFIQEARAAAAIGNDHIVQITDFGQLPDGAAYFVMEFLDGEELQKVIEERQKLSIEQVLDIMIQACEALGAAHSSDIIHRDLKPENISLIKKGDSDSFVKVLDFGIAKVAAGEEGKRLTKTGMIFGTPQYMSPEQAAGTGVDARTDIYSLGIIMYEMLSGHVPFEADTFMGVLTKHLYEEPIPPRRLVPPVEIDANVEAVLLKAIAKKPEKRYQSMADFRDDLKALAEGETPTIVYDQMRDTAATTVPPPSPSSVVGGKKRGEGGAVSAGRPKWPIFAGVGAVAVLGAVVAVLFFTGGDNGRSAQADPVSDEAARAAAATPDPEPEPEPEETEEEAAAESDEKPVYVVISSDRDGARIYNEKGALLGPLPFRMVRPDGDDPVEHYTVKKKGFEDVSVAVTSTTPEKLELSLEEVEEAKSGKSGRGGRGGGRSGGGRKTKAPASSGPEKVKVPKKKKLTGDLADPWAQ
ncbi:MAG: serine/threonine-protein kinase [Polyangia bacterium]